ncbi:MAG: glycosyltransferase [Patescibacteria group bacterium]
MKVALVHDHLIQDGGAEKVLQQLQCLFPEAPTFTLFYEPERVDPAFKKKEIRTSFLQRLPFARKKYQWLLPLMPLATELYDLSAFDVVISSSSAFSKGVIVKPSTIHLCYCHTPTRYLWSDTLSYVQELRLPRIFKKIIPIILSWLRIWDRHAADRVDVFIANSEAVRGRIKKYYRHDAIVIYPPVSIEPFAISNDQKTYYLAGGRLVSYKRIDLVIETCNRLRLPLKIFGSGPMETELKHKAGPTIEFVGRVSEKEKAKLYADCIAYIHPQEEDFGITAVEAMASGRPVIAYHRGGAIETVIEGITGTFFNEQSWEALGDTLLRFDASHFDPQRIRTHVQQFSTEAFEQKIKHVVERAWERHAHECRI